MEYNIIKLAMIILRSLPTSIKRQISIAIIIIIMNLALLFTLWFYMNAEFKTPTSSTETFLSTPTLISLAAFFALSGAASTILSTKRVSKLALDFIRTLWMSPEQQKHKAKHFEAQNNRLPLIYESTSGLINKRIYAAGAAAAMATLSWGVDFLYDGGLIAICLALSAVAIADAGLIAWGILSRDYGANAAEIEELLEFLLKQKSRGGGPSGGYRNLFPDESRKNAALPAGIGVTAGGH